LSITEPRWNEKESATRRIRARRHQVGAYKLSHAKCTLRDPNAAYGGDEETLLQFLDKIVVRVSDASDRADH